MYTFSTEHVSDVSSVNTWREHIQQHIREHMSLSPIHEQITSFYENHGLDYFQVDSLKKQRNDLSHVTDYEKPLEFAIFVQSEQERLKKDKSPLEKVEEVYSKLLDAVSKEYKVTKYSKDVN